MTGHAHRAHARFGASSADRWFACPGSVRACEGLPDAPSPAALEGTRAHELLETYLLGIGQSPEDGSEEMLAAVNVALDYVRDIVDQHPDAVLLVEHRFEIPVASAPGEVFGTNDACIFVPSLRLLYVVDFKYGHDLVEVTGNRQLRFYALGALANFVGIPVCDSTAIDTVALVIIQPRVTWADPVREEWLDVADVLEFGREIGEAVERCKKPDAPRVPGAKQCRYCAARLGCPERERAALDDAFGGVEVMRRPDGPPAPGLMSAGRIAELLAVRAQVDAYFDDVEAEAHRRLSAGEAVPGLKLVEARARREWVSDDAAHVAHALADICQDGGSCNGDLVAQFQVTRVRGLTEVEALLKRGADRAEARRRLDAMAFLTTKRSSGKLTVAREDDPRPAASRAETAFGDVRMIDGKGEAA